MKTHGHLLFSVLITIDGPDGVAPGAYLPRRSLRRALRGDWRRDSDDLEYAYVGEAWARGWSWQGAGVLTRSQTEALIDDCGLSADDTQTMGTLGGPLNPLGWAPDINFTSDDPETILSCRITPFFGDRRDDAADEERAVRKWERLRNAVIRHWEYGRCTHFRHIPEAACARWARRWPTWGPDYATNVRRECADMRRRRAEQKQARA